MAHSYDAVALPCAMRRCLHCRTGQSLSARRLPCRTQALTRAWQPRWRVPSILPRSS
jgi:hypothetical protein